jgi:hypothetical protein
MRGSICEFVQNTVFRLSATHPKFIAGKSASLDYFLPLGTVP